MQIAMPQHIRGVKGSAKTVVPTRMAVIGSNTPSTEVLVGPMYRDEIARASRAIRVGKTASHRRGAASAHEPRPRIKQSPSRRHSADLRQANIRVPKIST